MNDTRIFLSGDRSNYRIPSIIVTSCGTVMAFANDRRDTLIDHAPVSWLVMARKEAGGEWEELTVLQQHPGWSCRIESAVYDREADRTLLFFTRIAVAVDEFGSYTEEERARIAREAEERAAEAGLTLGFRMLVSEDDGRTWEERPAVCLPNSEGYIGFTHGCGPGIQLRHGPHAGRLLCPARYMTGHYTTFAELQIYGFNAAIYSDDHGLTWKTSEPVQPGTGEGTLCELPDGSILYNSRAFFHDQKRYLATSTDGGASYSDFRTDDFLLEEKNIGCNASLLCIERNQLKNPSILPDGAASVLLFANPRSAVRNNMTVCLSLDEGRTWREAKTVYAGPCAYSAMAYSEKDGLVYLLYELGKKNPYDLGLNAASFSVEELLNQ